MTLAPHQCEHRECKRAVYASRPTVWNDDTLHAVPASPRARALVIASLALAGTTACGDRAQRHATDGDTGAAAPATMIDMSATPRAGDSTAGVAKATGQPQNAGDTTGARGRDKTPGPKGGKPAMP